MKERAKKVRGSAATQTSDPPFTAGKSTFSHRRIHLSPPGNPPFTVGKSVFRCREVHLRHREIRLLPEKSAFRPRNLPFAVRQSTFRLREIHLSPSGNSPFAAGKFTFAAGKFTFAAGKSYRRRSDRQEEAGGRTQEEKRGRSGREKGRRVSEGAPKKRMLRKGAQGMEKTWRGERLGEQRNTA